MAELDLSEKCKQCELPVVKHESGSVNGGWVSWGCARCNLLRAEAAENALRRIQGEVTSAVMATR